MHRGDVTETLLTCFFLLKADISYPWAIAEAISPSIFLPEIIANNIEMNVGLSAAGPV
jgi:hypothetical protein